MKNFNSSPIGFPSIMKMKLHVVRPMGLCVRCIAYIKRVHRLHVPFKWVPRAGMDCFEFRFARQTYLNGCQEMGTKERN